jgi:hypothetical protein
MHVYSLQYFNRSINKYDQNEGQNRNLKPANKSSERVEISSTLVGLKSKVYSQRSS